VVGPLIALTGQKKITVIQMEKIESVCENGKTKSEACTNKGSPDIINQLQVPTKKNLADNYNLTEATNVGETSVDVRNQQKVMKSERGVGKWRIVRDVLMISFAFMVHFTAFIGTSHLQSSVNAAEGLGTTSLMTIYIGMSLSAIFLPVFLIKYVNSCIYYVMHYLMQLITCSLDIIY
jgi:hypothetical protein